MRPVASMSASNAGATPSARRGMDVRTLGRTCHRKSWSCPEAAVCHQRRYTPGARRRIVPIMAPTERTPHASTGIPGLDQLLRGGLPRDRMHLIEGEPGAGKTTLAL